VRFYFAHVRVLWVCVFTAAMLALLIFVRDGQDHRDAAIGIALWGVFVICTLGVAGGLAGLVWLIRATQRRPRRRPPTGWLVASAAIATVGLFPVPADWGSVEGENSVSGLVAAIEAPLVIGGLEAQPAFAYSETCCN
jgi:hypothetical protein